MAIFKADKVIVIGDCPGKLVGLRKRPGAPSYPQNKLYLPLEAIFEHEGKRRVESGGLLKRPYNPTFFTEDTLKRLIGISDGFKRSNGMMQVDVPGDEFYWDMMGLIGLRQYGLFVSELLKDRCPPLLLKKTEPN